jgi:hypothetical protein
MWIMVAPVAEPFRTYVGWGRLARVDLWCAERDETCASGACEPP